MAVLLPTPDRSLPESMVREHERHHRLDDGNRPRKDARVVTAPALQRGRIAFHVHGLLLLHDRGCRLESDADHNVLPVGYAALDTPGVVGARSDAPIVVVERVIVLRSGQVRSGKPGADLERLAGRKRQHTLARSASSLSNTGSPKPVGTFRATHSTTPPSESPSLRAS